MNEEEKNQSTEENKGESQGESVSTEQLLELEDTELKEKYGIEDPTNWKSYQRALHKEQKDRTEEREKFQQMLDDRDNKFNQTLDSHKLELEALKPKPAEEKLEPPKLSDSDDPLEVIKYLQETISYNNKVNDKKFQKFEERFGDTEKQMAQEQKLKEDARNLEMVKSTSKGVWLQEGLTPEEAEECWNWQATVKADDRIKTIGKMFKLSKGNGSSEVSNELKRRDGLKLDGASPGAGAGGGAASTDDPKDFTSTADHSDLYKIKPK